MHSCGVVLAGPCSLLHPASWEVPVGAICLRAVAERAELSSFLINFCLSAPSIKDTSSVVSLSVSHVALASATRTSKVSHCVLQAQVLLLDSAVDCSLQDCFLLFSGCPTGS